MGPIKLWPVAVLAVAAWVSVLVANVYLDQSKQKKNNWSELCTTADCSRYPMGYVTIGMGPGDFYVPFDADWLDLRSKGFVERDERGRALRAAYPDARSFKQIPCCRKLFASLQIEEDLIGSQLRVSEKLSLDQTDLLRGMRKLLGDRKIEDLDSWSEEFYLLHAGDPVVITPPSTGAPPSETIIPLKLISKKPMFFHRRIYMDCSRWCDVTAFADMDTASFPPQITVLSMAAMATRKCKKDPADCMPRDAVIGQIPRKIAALETMFRRLAERPATGPSR